jgi:hypothetical protein
MHNIMKIRRRKVEEIKQKLTCFINKRIFVANELRDADIIVALVEKLDGTKPHILIRIKNISKKADVKLPRSGPDLVARRQGK